MQLHNSERQAPRASVGLFKHQRKRDFLLAVAFSFRVNLKEAQRKRVFHFQDGLTTPNSKHFISTAHNVARFHLYKTLAVKEAREVKKSARQREERRAKIALKYGVKYGQLTLENARLCAKALGVTTDRQQRQLERAKFAHLFRTAEARNMQA